jgi:hypothetical protein
MICRTIQQMLLTSDRLDQPSADVAAHLAGCAACRGMQRRLVEAEQRLPLLAVPPSTRRDCFLQQVRQGTALPEPTVTPSELWLGAYRPPPKERGLKKLALSLALAASLLVFALAWWAWPHHSTTKTRPDPLVVRQKERDRLLTQAQTPGERVQVLANLARGLHSEARKLAHKPNPDELRVVARFYCEVVREDLLDQARQLPRGDRPMLEGVVKHLSEVESELGGLAVGEVDPDTADQLKEIVAAARASQDQLRQLLHA